MDILITGSIFIFGTIVGSFLNVLVIRYNTGRSTAGRSGCMNCGSQLKWFHLVPLLSFCVQSGRCTDCGCRLSWQYPIVEFLLGVLFVLSFTTASSALVAIFAAVCSAILLFIAVYDMRHTIIPNPAVYVLGVLALAYVLLMFFSTPLAPEDKILFLGIQIVAGFAVAAPLFGIWFFSKGRAMGFGDVKLALVLGWILGLYGGFQMLGLSFILGAVVGLVLLYTPRLLAYLPHSASLRVKPARFTLKSEIPFGPFLIVGFFLVFFFDVDLLAIMETVLSV